MRGPTETQEGPEKGRRRCRTLVTSMSAVSGDCARPPSKGPTESQEGPKRIIKGRKRCRTILTSVWAVSGDSAWAPEQAQNGRGASQHGLRRA